MKMSSESLDTTLFAPCGINCMVCSRHCGQETPCAGCLGSDLGKAELCRKCKIKNCVKERGLAYCYECPDYPCKLINLLEKSYQVRYHASLMENSDYVRRYGVEQFLETQKARYTCPHCGGIVSIHDRACTECQEKLPE